MAKCLVIGGGFAGLSSAVFLAEKGHQVKVIEASPKLGGRAYSFNYQNQIVDNGQHILMGCYLFTLEFLELIGSLDKIDIQPYLKVDFVKRGGNKFQLNAQGITYPFNILAALKNYNALNNSEKISVIKLFLKIAICNPKHYTTTTTKEFLESNHQTQNSINVLWDILHVGTMNCTLEDSSAEIFIRVLKQIFFTVDESTKIVLPKVGLSEMYCTQSEEFIRKKDGTISLSEKLLSINFDETENKVKTITTSKETYNDFDYLVLAISPHQLEKVIEQSNFTLPLPDYNYSSIINVHLWFKENSFTEKFYGLINSKFHWVFNHSEHITLTTSAADKFSSITNEEILEIAKKELKEFFPHIESKNISKHLIIHEKRATFIPSIENTIARKKIKNKISNLLLAGDWTNTNFPATIEGAVKSSALIVDSMSESL